MTESAWSATTLAERGDARYVILGDDLSGRFHRLTTVTYDVVLAADCRLPSVATPLADEIRAQHRAGYRTGMVHIVSGQHPEPAPFAAAIRACLERGEAEVILPGDTVRARVLVARSPATFRQLPDDLPTVRAERAVLVAEVAPIGDSGPRYDVDRVHGNLIRLAGTDVAWAPIAPHVREELAALGASPLLPADWEGVVDPHQWQGDRHGVIGERPVVGTVGEPSAPSDALVWRTHPAGSPPTPAFLSRVDVYVAESSIDSGDAARAVLEALAAGAIAVAPRHLEPLFGDVCLYGGLDDVRDQIADLHRDPDAFMARSRAGLELVQKRFGPDAHTDRIASLIGGAAETPETPGAEREPARGTVVVDLTRGERLDTLVSSIIRGTVAESGPRVVVLPAARAGELGARAAVETFPRVIDAMPAADRRRYLRNRLTGIAEAHRPRRIIVIDDGSLPARDILSGVDRVGTDVWHVQPVGTSEPDGEHLAERLGAVLPAGWGIGRMKPPDQQPSPQPPSAPSEDLLAKVGRRIRGWAAAAGGAIRRVLIRRLGGTVLESDNKRTGASTLRLPVATVIPGGDDLPVALVIITDAYADPAPGVRALAERRLVTGSFRPALLAPPDWEAEAAAAGITVETLLPEATWSTQYGPGWPGYVRRRIREACEVLGPTTVVLGTPVTEGEVLDVIESAGTGGH